jgi:CIC family chloride channel protein
MTSVFMIFELTQDYQVLVPLMIANMISFWISRRYQAIPLYRALLQQDHVHLPEVGARLPAGTWRARDIMTSEFALLRPVASVEDAARVANENGAKCFLVGENGLYSGLVTRDQIEQALQSGMVGIPISALVIKDYAHVHPDHPLELVLERLGKNPGILPVVSRSEVRHVEGVITPETMIQFLQKAWNNQGTSSTNGEKLH